MHTPLRILHLEDSQLDAELIHATLSEDGITSEHVRVDNRSDYIDALKRGGFDLIIADYSLPSFDGISALALAKEECPEIPFIFVSATLGEELAVETLKSGATDYVLKQRLSRLGPSLHRALREVDERTERKRAEEALRESEHQLRQSQKMEAVGRLAGGIAHDFNNLLTIIMGYSQVLLKELGSDHSLAGDIRETQKAVTQAALLIRQLLAFGRRQVLDPKVIDLNSVVENLQGMLGRLLGEDIKLIARTDPSLGQVKADQSQLEQVIMNLAVNARDAMPEGGSLTIETANLEISQASWRDNPSLQPGRYVTLAVSDTGCGMNPETQAKIFEPFFTTKEEGRGTGLGLATVHGIVKQSGGSIEVASQPGRGTTFTVYLPRTDETVPRGVRKKPKSKNLKGTETILLVEDEPNVRHLACDELRRLGYTVLEAQNGVEALLMSSQHPNTIHLLVTDVVMPGMNGRDVAHQLTAIRPNTKVLYVSGYTDDVGVMKDIGLAKATFLHKPFTPDILAGKVRELLDS